MTSREPRQFLEDIIDSARLAREYVRGLTFEQFEEAVEKQDAVIRRLEIIGEASANLPADITNAMTQVPWPQVKAMRNLLAHRYWGAELPRIWTVVHDDLPPLISAIEAYLP